MPAQVAVVKCENYHRHTVVKSLKRAVDLLGGMSRFVKPGERTLVKPNLCLPEPPERCLTTHPEVIRGTAELIIKAGGRVIVGDNPVGKATPARIEHIWSRSGLANVLSGLAYHKSLFQHDIQKRRLLVENKEYVYFISGEALASDVIINLPKFKTHSLMTFSGAVKNLYGLLPGNSKRKMHSELPAQEKFAVLLLDIYKNVRPVLHVMDAVVGIEGDGPGVNGEKRYIGLIMAGTDGVALDSVAARLMNMPVEDIPTNRIARQYNLGETDLDKIEILGDAVTEYIMPDFKRPATYIFYGDLTRKLFNISRAYVRINQEKCRRCLLCYDNCPTSAVKYEAETVLIDKSLCISCMTCHEICPAGAVYTGTAAFYGQLKQLRKRRAEKPTAR